MKNLTIIISLSLITVLTCRLQADKSAFDKIEKTQLQVDHTYAAFTAILSKHVKNELVDYAGLKKNPTLLNAYLDTLAAVPESAFNNWEKKQQMAFLINLYNAATLKLITDHYPIKSIKDIGGAKGPWKQDVVRLFGKMQTLDYIEHDLLRPKYKDPRVHFAVNCASIGCPALRVDAFQAAKLDVLIVMTRLPREGGNKTRLIPALGSAGATAFHDRLARHAVGRASSYAMMHPGTRLQVHLDGGTPADGRAWLGEIDCHTQSEGHLGKRMQSAVDLAFSNGAGRVVVIGTDCPSIDEAQLEIAFDALDYVDLVFGPAADGGYYLVGLSRRCPAIFCNIEWGSPQVLKQSLSAARNTGLYTTLLEVLSDVDLPADLPAANAALIVGTSLSVIIPTLNEEVRLPLLLDRLKRCGSHEIIVADGGSHDRTMEIAEQAGVRVISAEKGRGSQMNRATAMATGEFLLFLHADTMPPPEYQQVVTRLLQSSATSAGAFRFGLTGGLPSSPLIESLVNLRCRLLGTPYGDQGLFMRRRIFQHLGGYPDWPVMEDLHLVRQLKRLGPVRMALEAARTSTRRWEKYGTVRTFLSNQLMLAAYHLGLPIKFIARFRP